VFCQQSGSVIGRNNGRIGANGAAKSCDADGAVLNQQPESAVGKEQRGKRSICCQWTSETMGAVLNVSNQWEPVSYREGITEETGRLRMTSGGPRFVLNGCY